MIIEREHRNATFSREADKLEEEIGTIEQSIVNITRELMAKIKGRMIGQLKRSHVTIILVSFVLIKMVGSAFSRQGSMERKISRLRKQNTELKNQNRKLQQILSRRIQKKRSPFFRF